jgi:hypothetical protein
MASENHPSWFPRRAVLVSSRAAPKTLFDFDQVFTEAWDNVEMVLSCIISFWALYHFF